MTAALVDLEVELRGVEDDRPPAGRQLRRGEKLHGLGRDPLGRARQVERADVLVAGALPSAARIGVAAALVLLAVDGVRLDPGPTWVITCSVELPSLAANVFSSRWAP